MATSFVPPGVIAGYTPPAGLTYDVAAAQALLAEAGYANGAGLPPLELLFPPGDERVCQAVARQWEQALGVQINLRTKESKTLSEDLAHHRFQIARANWYADYKDPTTFLDCLVDEQRQQRQRLQPSPLRRPARRGGRHDRSRPALRAAA